jgi:hypothetical protein
MPNELTNSLKIVAEKVAGYVSKAAELSVETQYIEVGTNEVNFEAAHPAASTVIKLDGDCKSVIPVRRTESGSLEVDAALFELHERNVATAIDYRTRMMDALLQTLRDAVK